MTGKTCEICGANTPYTDWTRCERHNTRIADADRIAALQDELADKESDRARIERLYREEQRRHAASDAAHERTKAELVEARDVAQLNATDCKHLRQSAITLETERDAAQAEAAAQVEKWQRLKPVVVDFYRELRTTENQIESACDYVSMGRRVEYLEDVLISLRDRVYDSLQEYYDDVAALDAKEPTDGK